MDEDRRVRGVERMYGALGAHLAARAAAGERRVTLTFAVIEGTILGGPLPRSARHARHYRHWWRGGSAGYTHGWYGWQRVGWHVAAVDLAAETVTFVRAGDTE